MACCIENVFRVVDDDTNNVMLRQHLPFFVSPADVKKALYYCGRTLYRFGEDAWLYFVPKSAQRNSSEKVRMT